MAKHCKSRQFHYRGPLLEGWMMLDVGLMHKLHTGLNKGKSPWFKTISKSGMSTVALSSVTEAIFKALHNMHAMNGID